MEAGLTVFKKKMHSGWQPGNLEFYEYSNEDLDPGRI